MPSRRRLIATAVASTTTLAGCLGAGTPDGISSTFDDEWVSSPDDATVVARTETDRSNGPGRIWKQGTVYEVERASKFVVLTEYRVIPPDEGSVHTGFREIHDWSESDLKQRVESHASNVVPTDEDDPPLRLEDSSTTSQGHWYVHLTPPGSAPVTYRFLTQVAGTNATDGDLVAVVQEEARFERNGLFGDEIRTTMDTRLVYGEVDEN